MTFSAMWKIFVSIIFENNRLLFPNLPILKFEVTVTLRLLYQIIIRPHLVNKPCSGIKLRFFRRVSTLLSAASATIRFFQAFDIKD